MKRKIFALFVLLLLSVCYSQQIQIPIHFENSPTTVELYNVKGQKILSKEFSKYTSVPFSLSNNLSNQIYIMRIKNGAKEFTRKFTPNTKIQFIGSFTNSGVKQTRLANEAGNRSNEAQIQRTTRSLGDKPDPALDSITNIVFVNGIWNTKKEANNNLLKVLIAYEKTLNSTILPFPGGRYKFTLAYNNTHKEELGGVGHLYDVAEAAHMIYKEANIPESFIEEILMPWMLAMMPVCDYVGVLDDNYSKILSDSLNVEIKEEPASFFEKFSNALAAVKEKTSELIRTSIYSVVERYSFISKALMLVSDPIIIEPIVEKNIKETSDSIKAIIGGSLDRKERVIVIAHSQGNLYMNKLIEDIGRERGSKTLEHITVLNIATPSANTSVDSGWYWTNKNDEVINSARALINNNILPGYDNYKVSYLGSINDDLNHKFYESYFHNAWKSRGQIDTMFFWQCRNLSFWGVEKEEEYYDSTEYYIIIRNYGGCPYTIEILQNDGNYLVVSNYNYVWIPGSDDYYTNDSDTTIVSNIAFQNGSAVFKITYPESWNCIYDEISCFNSGRSDPYCYFITTCLFYDNHGNLGTGPICGPRIDIRSVARLW